jgi:site-specific DNA recombinase
LERQRAKNRAVEDRRATLAVELAATNEKLNRLYRAIEDGIVDPDAQLKERVDALKTQRDLAQASLDRIAVQADTRAMITRIGSPRSSSSCEKKLDTGDTWARKAYLQSVISQIEVDDDRVRTAIRLCWPLSSQVAKWRGPSSRFCTQLARQTE